MNNILQEIYNNKIKELEETKKRCSYKTLEKLISSNLKKAEFKKKLINSQLKYKHTVSITEKAVFLFYSCPIRFK